MFVHSKTVFDRLVGAVVVVAVVVLSSSMSILLMPFHVGNVMGEETTNTIRAALASSQDNKASKLQLLTVDNRDENENSSINDDHNRRRRRHHRYLQDWDFTVYSNHACRTASGTKGIEGVDFDVFYDSSNWNDCEDRCHNDDYCWGYEYEFSSKRCETWNSDILKGVDLFEPKEGIRCAVVFPVETDPSPPDPLPIEPNPIEYIIYENSVCRTAQNSKGEDGDEFDLEYVKKWSDRCEELCDADPGCQGFEQKQSTGRCELWQETPMKTDDSEGSECWVKSWSKPGETCGYVWKKVWECS